MSKSVSAAVPSITAQAISPLPDGVKQLRQSVVALDEAVEVLCVRSSLSSEAKRDARLVAAVGKRLDSAIVSACAQRPGELHVLAKSHVAVARESIFEWTQVVHERGTISTAKSLKLRWDTAAQLRVFAIAIQVIEEMLEIENGTAQLVLDPARLLGLSEAKPSCDLCVYTDFRDSFAEGFKVVVQGLANMTDGAPWPWKAIPQTMLQFTTLVERALDQPKKIQDISDKIAQRIASLLDISQNNGGHNTELDNYVESFLADVQRIIVRLRIVERVRPLKAFPLTDYIENIIATEAEKMQDAYRELQARFIVHTAYTAQTIACAVAAIQGTAVQTLAVVVDTRTEVKAVGVMVTEIHAAVAGPSTKPLSQIPARAKLPARPIYFNGRDARLDEIVALICMLVATRIAIMGPGGIGKTSLALAVLYDSRVIEVVGDHRFFISVEGMIDIDAASTHLANHLGLDASSDPLSSAIGYLQSLPRALLVVDNLETLWFSNNASACVDTEQFLSRLAEVSSLTLLITSRGAVPPDGIATLPAESTEQAVLDTLLIELDCVPLAVTLLAKLAVRKNSPSDLLRRWKKSRTKLLCTQGEHRLRSVDVSITVSLDLLKGMSRGLEAMQLLAVCAHLPDGLMRPVFEQLDENFGNIDAAKDMLVEFALVTVGAEGELKMLSPIRYFVIESHKMTDTHFVSLQQIYFDIAASAPQEPADDFTRRSTQFAPEYGNLTSFLLHLINSEEPSKKLFDAVHAVSEYAYCTMPSPTLREALLLRLTTQTAWRAECLQGLGRTRLRRDEYSHATENLQAARILYAKLGNKFREAECRSILGLCMWMQDLFDAAEPELRAARDIFIELGYEYDAARCTKQLGNICRLRGEYDQAIDHLTSARDTFKRHGEQLYAAQCTQSIGQIQLGQGNLSAAESDFQSALSEFEALGSQLGAMQCTRMLGERHVTYSRVTGRKTLPVARSQLPRARTQVGVKNHDDLYAALRAVSVDCVVDSNDDGDDFDEHDNDFGLDVHVNLQALHDCVHEFERTNIKDQRETLLLRKCFWSIEGKTTIFDEGHVLKNCQSQQYQNLLKID
ncbi:hypothetical protein BKA62DRAFT_774476 [Auriculariales sp. MPI-PUGE-AT-0066]|nr:hypothetical protein BKA62DRAFT_774476 [Auriculariales sp. MPI-PUGE-AT-0066]